MTNEEHEDVVDKWVESDINKVKLLRPSDLKGLTQTSLEISMEYSYRLRQRAKNEWLEADNIKTIATSMEEFATCLIEPLKYNRAKAAIFADEIDRVAGTALLFEQKKFLCHMVVYELLMRRWSGVFYELRSSSRITAGWLKWILLNIWAVCDMALFPLNFSLLYLLHMIVKWWKERQEYHVIFLLNESRQHTLSDTFSTMQDVSMGIMNAFLPVRCAYACIIRKNDELFTKPFSSNRDVSYRALQGNMSGMEMDNISSADTQVDILCLSLTKAKELFDACNECRRKVLVVISDETVSSCAIELPTGVKVIAVGFGEDISIDDLKHLTNNEENIILHHDDRKMAKVCQKISTCIYERDIYDRYREYFTMPFFIFLRNTLGYFILLALHFEMCLLPSTLQFIATEWVILLFFVGRFTMEIDRIVQLRRKLRNTGFKATSKYLGDPWNRMDVLSLLIYVVLLVVRILAWSFHGSVQKNRLLAMSGYMYGLNAMVITLRVFGHIMETNAFFGTIQIALFQIIGSCIAIFGQFLVALIAFSLAITKVYVAEISYITVSNTTSKHGLCEGHGGIACWWRLNKYLIWSVLGYGGPEPLQSADDTSNAIVLTLYALFLILAVVMLMNMMIALLSNTYQHVEDSAYYEWSYRKTATIVTYLTHHPVPVPFNIVSLPFVLARYIYRQLSKSTQTVSNSGGERFKRLVTYLENRYISVNGNKFAHALTDNSASLTVSDDQGNSLKNLIKQTEGNGQLIGRIIEREFKQDREEQYQLKLNGAQAWHTKGISVMGQRLLYSDCFCNDCTSQPSSEHGARYKNRVSIEWPGFEILVQSSKDCSVAFGVVDGGFSLHKIPGAEGNTVGCKLGPGSSTLLYNGNYINIKKVEVVQYDVLSCEICYDQWHSGNLPVVFTRNNDSIGEAHIIWNGLDTPQFYPFLSLSEPGCILRFRLLPLHPYGVHQATKQFNQIMLKLDDLSTNYSDIQKRFSQLQSNYLDLQKDYSRLQQDLSTITPSAH